MADKEGTARELWKKFKEESIFGMYTPFFVCLASGKLDSETFGHFLSFDAHYRNLFIVAYEMAEKWADAEEDKIKLRKLKESVEKDYKICNIVPRDYKICNIVPLVKKCRTVVPIWSRPDIPTRKYTYFLRSTASGMDVEDFVHKMGDPVVKTKVAAYTLGAMAPWKRFYSFISNEIQAVLDPDDSSHSYKKWIDIYSSQEYEASTLLAEDILDKLSVSLTREDIKVMENLYHQAIKFVVDFFAAQPITQHTIVPLSRVLNPAKHRLSIFSDFDLRRCTGKDTSAILAQIAILTLPQTDSNSDEAQLAQRWSIWDQLFNQYIEEYENCIESIMPSERVKFNYQVISNAFVQFSEFERRQNTIVVQSRILECFKQEDVEMFGQCFDLLDGCDEFFQKIAESENLKTDFHILSYGWFGDFIRSAFLAGDLNVPNIHSNELVYNQATTCTGEIVWNIESPMGKLRVFREIILEETDDMGSDHITVYIGASVGDLLCLLNADLGIVIGSSPSLRKLGEQFGISFEPLFSGVVKKQKKLAESGVCPWDWQSGNLYTVSCWAEIHAFIFGS